MSVSKKEVENPSSIQCECRKKVRDEATIKSLNTRLNRIEGQVKGIKKMLENDTYCIDILTQTSAVQAALNSFKKELLTNHIQTCVVDDLKNDNNETIEELLNALQKMWR